MHIDITSSGPASVAWSIMAYSASVILFIFGFMQSIPATQPINVVEYPTLADRVQSTFIDTLLIVILMFVFATILDKYENPPDWIRVVLFFAIWGVYEPLCTTLGFTIGNYIKGIRVRKASDPAKRINILQALFRYIFKIGLGWISFLTMHLNPQKRAIHDFIAGSVMIKK